MTNWSSSSNARAMDSLPPVRYLSDEWLDAADAALRDLPPTDTGALIGFSVTGGPSGDRRYTLRLGPDSVGIDRSAEPEVTLCLPWACAIGIARGETSAQRAVLDGVLIIEGDAGILLGHTGSLSAVDDRLRGLRDRTEF